MTWLKHKGKYFNINENKWKSVRGHDCEGGSMSKTPRTDEHLRMKEKNGHVAIVSRDFARQLETELADKEKQLAEAWAEIERFKSVEQAQIDMLMSITGGSIVCANGSRHTIIIDTCLYCELADKEKQLAEAWAEIERLKHIKRCLREEFLLNTQNYPKEYHALFQRKFKAALSAAERGGK